MKYLELSVNTEINIKTFNKLIIKITEGIKVNIKILDKSSIKVARHVIIESGQTCHN